MDLDENHLDKILKWSVNSNRITNINELVNDNYKFIWMQPSKSALRTMDYDKGNILFVLQKPKQKHLLFILKIHN